MIKLINKYISRLKHGYKIGEDLYLTSPSKDELIVANKNRKLKIYFERFPSKPDRVLYKSDEINYLPPHDDEVVTEKEYQYILNAVVKHFENLGEEVKCE